MFIKEHVITQIQKDFGYTRKQAVDYYNKIDDEYRKELDAEFNAEVSKSFRLKEILKKHNFSDEEIEILYNIVEGIARDEAENVKNEYLDYINDPYR